MTICSDGPAILLDTMTETRLCKETFEKCQFLFKFKEGEKFNHRNTLSILRIKIAA